MSQIDLDKLACEAETVLEPIFKELRQVSDVNTKKILKAFRENRVSSSHFMATDGYGYDDKGRDTLDKIYAEVFGVEAAFVRHSIANGTHALAIGLYGLLRPGDIMLSVTGAPYDTLHEVINGNTGDGSLYDFGVEYREQELEDGKIDLEAMKAALISDEGKRIKVVYAQRSKGYLDRPTLTSEELNEAARLVHECSDAYFVCDNCYGEFTETIEPYECDLIIGSLIKNPGGGMADSGGYICGSKRAVELASYRLTTPGVGLEVGASLGQSKAIYKGLFYAPHTVSQAIMTAHFAAYIFEKLGFVTEPRFDARRSDIIQAIKFGTPEGLCAFCRGIQYGSPIDAFVTPEPWEMPGYADQVIMAAGTFCMGASIELSADGPLRPPYTAFFQGGLTFESGKIGVLSAAEEVLRTVINENIK